MQEAQKELEVSRQLYADLYDLAPVGYLTLTRAGCIREINMTGMRMLGTTRSRLLGGPLLPFITAPYRRKYLSHLTRLRNGEAHASTEVEIVSRSGQVATLQLLSAISSCIETSATLFRTVMV